MWEKGGRVVWLEWAFGGLGWKREERGRDSSVRWSTRRAREKEEGKTHDSEHLVIPIQTQTLT